jgi:hypothetical protein
MFNIRKVSYSISKYSNESKLLFGIAMILFNLGAKYINMDISKTNETFLKSTIVRRITIFCMFFVATRDLFLSLAMSAVFIIFALGLFNEKSSAYVFPQSFYDDTVTEEEYTLAKDLIAKYEKNRQQKT